MINTKYHCIWSTYIWKQDFFSVMLYSLCKSMWL